MAPDLPGIESTQTCPPGSSNGSTSGRGHLLTAPPHVSRSGLSPAKSSKTLISGMADKCFQAEPDRVGVCRRSTRLLRSIEEFVVDVQRFFHMATYTIQVWLPFDSGNSRLRHR